MGPQAVAEVRRWLDGLLQTHPDPCPRSRCVPGRPYVSAIKRRSWPDRLLIAHPRAPRLGGPARCRRAPRSLAPTPHRDAIESFTQSRLGSRHPSSPARPARRPPATWPRGPARGWARASQGIRRRAPVGRIDEVERRRGLRDSAEPGPGRPPRLHGRGRAPATRPRGMIDERPFRRGAVSTADLGGRRRPVVIVTHDRLCGVLSRVSVSGVTTRRRDVPTEVEWARRRASPRARW